MGVIESQELEALIETAELLQVPKVLADISQAREEYKQGRTVGMEDLLG